MDKTQKRVKTLLISDENCVKKGVILRPKVKMDINIDSVDFSRLLSLCPRLLAVRALQAEVPALLL